MKDAAHVIRSFLPMVFDDILRGLDDDSNATMKLQTLGLYGAIVALADRDQHPTTAELARIGGVSDSRGQVGECARTTWLG